jgi:hypothetical protein
LDKQVSGGVGAMIGISYIGRNKIEPADPTAQCGGILLNNCSGTMVEGNHVGSSFYLGTTTGSTSITLQSCDRIKLRNNAVYLSIYCTGYNIDSNCTNIVYSNGVLTYYSPTNYTEIVDNGIGTKGLWKALAYNTNWSRYSASSTALCYMKDENNVVHLMGQVTKSTAVVGGDLIATLPTGFQVDPDTTLSGNVRLMAPWLNNTLTGSTAVSVRVIAASGLQGQIWLDGPLSNFAYVSLDGLSFKSAEV